MLSRDLVHLCDHELPTREEKRENKVIKIKQSVKQNVKNTVQKEALFFPHLQPWLLNLSCCKQFK